MKTQSSKANQKKLLLMLPLLVLPFITMGFWALGGGQGQASKSLIADKGLNLNLPDAHNDSGPKDKMSFYDLAAADSAKQKERSRNDPYYQDNQVAANAGQPYFPGNTDPSVYSSNGNQNAFGYRDPNEAKVYEKLGQLNRAMQQPAPSNNYGAYQGSAPGYNNQSVNTMDIERLEKMMQSMQQGDSGDDAETRQLNAMLERILDIQHPERVQEKIKQSQAVRKGEVYAVTDAVKKDRISVLDNAAQKVNPAAAQKDNGFYGLSDSIGDVIDQNAIEAVIHEDQSIVNGSTVKLRLIDDINVKGVAIPKGNFIFGTASLEGDRLTVKIGSLRYKKSLYPVQLSIFDIDGLDGIYIPGAIARDVAKSSAERSIQTIGLSSFDQSLGAQAAGAGIEAAKTFLGKKVKLIKVMVKAGYKVLLRDDSQKQ